MAEHHIRKTYDPVTGFTDELWYDDLDKQVHVRRTQDIEPQLRHNKLILNSSPKNFSRDDGLYKKAVIPHAIIEKWLIEDGFNWFRCTDAERRKKLNQHPEYHVRAGKV